jgi:gamma-glutamyl phosphate reductase
MDLIGKILELNTNLNVYVKEFIDFEYEDSITVSDVEEAISYINNTGSRNASAIFTSDDEAAKEFVKGVKSKVVLVNTNPSYDNRFDISQKDLLREKRIIIPR